MGCVLDAGCWVLGVDFMCRFVCRFLCMFNV